MSYASLVPLLKKTGSSLTPQEFQARINVVFHDYEASHYDNMHKDMWESLQEQINLLVDDLFAFQTPSKKVSLLDIGCGTGLSTQKLLLSKLGTFIDEITLLDTSSNMLQQAEAKAQNWNKKYTVINADVLSITTQFDVVIICSVLHHIPDLKQFLNHIDTILKPGGILIHLQDPNGDYLNDPIYQKRLEEYSNATKSVGEKKSIVDYIPKKWKNSIKRALGRKTYIDFINDQLLAEKVIKRRMTADEIWSVTDIHVESKLNPANAGISFHFLKEQLHNFQLIKQRSYAFYSFLKSELPEGLQTNEARFIAQNELNGRNISCVWIKK
jgi:2-polyprenyl-3-methyl-5-hydroxy-6-metoxy-1,4-benzoquinol methylase